MIENPSKAKLVVEMGECIILIWGSFVKDFKTKNPVTQGIFSFC